MNVWKAIDGYKTYFGVLTGGIVMLLRAMNVISEELSDALLAVVAVWTGVAFRHAISKATGGPNGGR